MKWGNACLFVFKQDIHSQKQSKHNTHLWPRQHNSSLSPSAFFFPLCFSDCFISFYMTHSSSCLLLPQRDYILTHTDHFSPGGSFVPTATLSSQPKHIPTEMQQGHFIPPQSLSALLRLLKHREARPSLAIWEFQKCTLIFHASRLVFVFFFNVRFKQSMVSRSQLL